MQESRPIGARVVAPGRCLQMAIAALRGMGTVRAAIHQLGTPTRRDFGYPHVARGTHFRVHLWAPAGTTAGGRYRSARAGLVGLRVRPPQL